MNEGFASASPWLNLKLKDMINITPKMAEKLDLVIDESPSYVNALCRWIFDDNAPMSDYEKLREHYCNDDLEWLANYNN